MMISENERFKEQYDDLKNIVAKGANPLIITEGKTDIKHLRKAKQVLKLEEIDLEFYDAPNNWGDSKLFTLLDNLAKVPQHRKIIGIFDRDSIEYINKIEQNGESFKSFGNNVFAFCLPTPQHRADYKNIYIEMFYNDQDLKKEFNGKALYFDNEVTITNESAARRSKKIILKLEQPLADDELSKKIFDEDIGNADWIHSKAVFADLTCSPLALPI